MILKLTNKTITAEINSLGAELIRLCNNSTNYIWEVDTKFWNKTSPILFPIVGRLKNDTYQIDEKLFRLPRHGFARDFNFEIIEHTKTVLILSLKENVETLKLYPFSFELQIHYILSKIGLEIKYLIKNCSSSLMPFSIGAHPAFRINPLLENYSIQFDRDTQLETHELENEQFSGKTRRIHLKNNTLALSYSLFEKDALVFKNINSRNLVLFENNTPFLKINLGNFPHLGIWTKDNAQFLCIEPWFGYADSINTNGIIFDKEGIQLLQPKQIFDCYFAIEFL